MIWHKTTYAKTHDKFLTNCKITLNLTIGIFFWIVWLNLYAKWLFLNNELSLILIAFTRMVWLHENGSSYHTDKFSNNIVSYNFYRKSI